MKLSAYQRECERLRFMGSRDGLAGALAFAEQGVLVYTTALATPYGKAYKKELVISLIVYRYFLLTNGVLP